MEHKRLKAGAAAGKQGITQLPANVLVHCSQWSDWGDVARWGRTCKALNALYSLSATAPALSRALSARQSLCSWPYRLAPHSLCRVLESFNALQVLQLSTYWTTQYGAQIWSALHALFRRCGRTLRSIECTRNTGDAPWPVVVRTIFAECVSLDALRFDGPPHNVSTDDVGALRDLPRLRSLWIEASDGDTHRVLAACPNLTELHVFSWAINEDVLGRLGRLRTLVLRHRPAKPTPARWLARLPLLVSLCVYCLELPFAPICLRHLEELTVCEVVGAHHWSNLQLPALHTLLARWRTVVQGSHDGVVPMAAAAPRLEVLSLCDRKMPPGPMRVFTPWLPCDPLLAALSRPQPAETALPSPSSSSSSSSSPLPSPFPWPRLRVLCATFYPQLHASADALSQLQRARPTLCIGST